MSTTWIIVAIGWPLSLTFILALCKMSAKAEAAFQKAHKERFHA